MTRALPSPLYAILDPDVEAPHSWIDVANGLIATDCRLIQLRMKHRSSREFLEAAIILRALAAKAGATLLINDRVDIALAAHADGVHLGADDLPVEEARRLLGSRMLIGRSTHSLDEAIAAARSGADYIAFGPIFPTTTKKLSDAAQGLERLRSVCARVSIPIVAIGGITEATAPAVRKAGADAAAMIGEIARAANVAETARRLLAALR